MKRELLAAAMVTILCVSPGFGAAKTVSVKVRVDSEAPGYEGYKAMDGNASSMWHTRWEAGETPHPHQIVVDLGAEYPISGITYLPRPVLAIHGNGRSRFQTSLPTRGHLHILFLTHQPRLLYPHQRTAQTI